jgi:CubicO group peptidase (beta-lactamase class C family)
LNGSVRDMSRFMRMVLNEGSLDGSEILSKITLKKMLSVQNNDNPFNFGFKMGLGYFLHFTQLEYA